MRGLSIDAAMVPIIYRVKAWSVADIVGESTVQCLPSEIQGKADAVRDALTNAGYVSVSVEFWEA